MKNKVISVLTVSILCFSISYAGTLKENKSINPSEIFLNPGHTCCSQSINLTDPDGLPESIRVYACVEDTGSREQDYKAACDKALDRALTLAAI